MKFKQVTGKRLGVTLALLLTLIVAGCANKNQHVINLPNGVSENEVKDWYAAVGALSEVATVTKAATAFAIQVNQAKSFEGSGYETTLRVLGKIDQGGIATKNFLETAPQSFGSGAKDKSFAYADEALVQLGQAEQEGLLGVHDAAAKEKLTTFFGSLRTALMTIKLLSQVNTATAPTLTVAHGGK